MFFYSHKCNSLCKLFNLINLGDTGYLPTIPPEEKEDQKSYKPCDICRNVFYVKSVDYLKARKERKEMYCH